ncbi:MAG: hypothetical protein JNK15_06345 [Planctomycetes bacterium]|nr:hypothetical protein [Planctomycetota bacterium]
MSKRGAFVVAAIATLFVLQAGGAGAAFWLRRDGDAALVVEQTRVGELQAEAERAVPAPAVEVALPKSPWQLHDNNDVTGAIEMLQGLCDTTGTSVEGIKALSATTPGKQAFQLNLRGTPRQVANLLIELEQNPRLHVVESGRVAPGGTGLVAVDLAVAIWHRGGLQ